jgi:hypothetical protein
MKKLMAFVFVLLIGCTHAVTSTKSEAPYLQPQTLKGPIEDIYEVAFRAAKRAFPEEEDIRKGDDWKVIIERDWFWRGDTVITVTVNKVSEEECIISVESKASWHRMNPCIAGVAQDELEYYGKALEEEYAEFKSPKQIENSLTAKLDEIKQVYEKGLINKDEYESKKAEILKGY